MLLLTTLLLVPTVLLVAGCAIAIPFWWDRVPLTRGLRNVLVANLGWSACLTVSAILLAQLPLSHVILMRDFFLIGVPLLSVGLNAVAIAAAARRKRFVATAVSVPVLVAAWVLGGVILSPLRYGALLSRTEYVAPSLFRWRSDAEVYYVTQSGSLGRFPSSLEVGDCLIGTDEYLVLRPAGAGCWYLGTTRRSNPEAAKELLRFQGTSVRFVDHAGTGNDLRGREPQTVDFELLGLGLALKSRSGSEQALLGAVTPVFARPLSNLTMLPGDQLVVEIGGEVAVLDWESKTMAVLGKGRSPVAIVGGACRKTPTPNLPPTSLSEKSSPR